MVRLFIRLSLYNAASQRPHGTLIVFVYVRLFIHTSVHRRPALPVLFIHTSVRRRPALPVCNTLIHSYLSTQETCIAGMQYAYSFIPQYARRPALPVCNTLIHSYLSMQGDLHCRYAIRAYSLTSFPACRFITRYGSTLYIGIA